jgi:flagellar biosynthesis GTPase FlhF
MKRTGTPEERREYARMEREGRAQEKKRENLARLEEKRAKIKEFRKKRAEKEKKEEPARAMAQEIVQTVQENANNIINNDPILDDELFTQKPIYAPKVNKEFTGGLHENFVNQKLAEGNILKKIDKEIENENI